MLNRSLITCKSCNQYIVLRVGVGLNDEQRFVFQCPNCACILRGCLRLHYQPSSLSYESEDFMRLDEDPPDDASIKGVTVYTDLPVHRSCQGKALGNGGSAFLALQPLMGDGFIEFNQRKDLAQHIRAELFRPFGESRLLLGVATGLT